MHGIYGENMVINIFQQIVSKASHSTVNTKCNSNLFWSLLYHLSNIKGFHCKDVNTARLKVVS